MKFAPYSFSKINSFETCPRKFKYTYIDKAPKKLQNLEPLLKGGAVHNIIEHYPEESTHKLASKYMGIFTKFHATNLGKFLLDGTSGINELDIGLTKELKPCKYSDKDALFRGSVDYVYSTGSDILYLKDWKTGKLREQRWQNYSQLMYYGLYFFQAIPSINKIDISYVYVEHPEEQNDLLLERKYLKNYKINLLTHITTIEAEKDFPKTTKNVKLCSYCEYQEYCNQDS